MGGGANRRVCGLRPDRGVARALDLRRIDGSAACLPLVPVLICDCVVTCTLISLIANND